MDYGSVPRKDDGGDSFMGMEATSFRVFLTSFCFGLATFIGTLILFNTILYTHENTVIWLSIFTLVLCAFLILAERFPNMSSKSTSAWSRPIGASCFVALLVGIVFGLFCYDVYGYFSFIYRNARTYQNTVPSAKAASVADAGRMVFAAEAFVDQTKSVGYSAANGHTYCVAPIRDMVETDHVEFWAVGYDCCSWSGKFTCDAVADTEARGGIVVFDNPGYFMNSNRDYYNLARKKAEASYDLKSTETPLYVRWVKNDDLSMLQRFYEYRTVGFIFLISFLYGTISLVFVWFYSNSYFKNFEDRQSLNYRDSAFS